MASFLDAYPIQWADPRVRDLYGALTASIYRERDIEQIVIQAGVPPANVAWVNPPRTLWFDALNEAANQRRLPALIKEVTEQYPALEERVTELLATKPVVTARIAATERGALAPADARWAGFTVDGRERQIVEGDETLLDISFLELGVQRASAVCRLTAAFESGVYHGTGFRIGPSLLLTNHHVLYDWEDGDAHALSVEAAFGYETDLEGKLRKATVVVCDVDTIRGERAHDFAVISPIEPLPGAVPELSLAPKRAVEVDQRVVIVQHPGGLPKKIAFAHNLVRHVDDDVVQYWTDTEQGSSGSPVFNESWEVVALHHYWVDSPLDKNSFRNQGRNIVRVAERIEALDGG
jgi:V8-like Glu-specific endopeptidase